MRRCLSLLLILLFIAYANPVQFCSATAPTVLNVTPVNGATNISFNNNVTKTVYLRANITDIDGDLKYIRFETNRTGNWSKIADANISGNWSTGTYIPFSNLSKNTKYWWRIKARDNSSNWTNTTAFSFKIKADGTGGGTYNNGTGGGKNITIVPSQPKADGTVIFIINRNNASGYVICNATMNVYPVIFNQGLGSVKLGADYGQAMIYVVNYGTKIFTIKHEFEGAVSIDAPTRADINNEVKIAVMAAGEYIPSTLSLTSPSQITTSRQTGTAGPIAYTFTEPGNWTLTANAYSSNVTRKIFINPDPLTINVAENIIVGHDTTITVNERDAQVVIKKGDATWTYISDTNGEVVFEPLFSGRYSITATTPNQRGTKTFDVKSSTEIIVKNIDGAGVTSITEGDMVLIQVQDSDENNVQSSTIEVYGDNILLKTLQLNGGFAMWKATPQAKVYKFSYNPESSLLLPTSLDVVGVPPDMTMIYIAVAIVAIVIFITILLLNRAGYLNISKLKGLSGGVKDDLL